MRWFVLLAVLGSIFWTANWSYHLLDDAVLITDYWPSQGGDQSWKLVNYIEDQAHLYTFNSSNGYWAIFKSLWPVWTLFILSFIILIPLARYIYVGLNNTQIASAKEAQMYAEKQAKKAQSEARSYELKVKAWAEEQINNAYQKQLSRVKKELENEWNNYHQQKNALMERESKIQHREQTAQNKEESAKQEVIALQEQHQQEKVQFDEELQKNTTAKKNAQSGQKRLRKEKQIISQFLENERWTIGNTPLTYERLRTLAKVKQP
jgi:flagellar biosynthesis GTPase FlhF